MFVLILLTSVIELNNLLRYTTLEYLNANDRNMAIISLFYMDCTTTQEHSNGVHIQIQAVFLHRAKSNRATFRFFANIYLRFDDILRLFVCISVWRKSEQENVCDTFENVERKKYNIQQQHVSIHVM